MNKNGTLYIVATPIGNLEDITFRAVRILGEVDLVACEDTRVTSKLLSHYSISKPLISLHHHSGKAQFEKIVAELENGKNVAYCSDAGTPGVSDPGNRLVEDALQSNIAVVPIPGVSALTALVSVAGMDMQNFSFAGFPPHKKGRETFFRKIVNTQEPVIYYDSPHRVIKNIQLLKELTEKEKNVSDLAAGTFGKQIIIGRELTKMFEQIVRGNMGDVIAYFSEHPDKLKGEFVIIAY
ncbi:MAG TPA: 16S rRNA (cytidine(1402)-2'-O)-methyltransferase [Patescibacteria group bacterium]